MNPRGRGVGRGERGGNCATPGGSGGRTGGRGGLPPESATRSRRNVTMPSRFRDDNPNIGSRARGRGNSGRRNEILGSVQTGRVSTGRSNAGRGNGLRCSVHGSAGRSDGGQSSVHSGRASAGRGQGRNSSVQGGRLAATGRGGDGGRGHASINQNPVGAITKAESQSDDEATQDTGNKQEGLDETPTPWKNSEAKKKLYALIVDDYSWVHLCTYREIHEGDPDFGKYKLGNFSNNARLLFKNVQKAKEAVAFDRASLDHDVDLYPRNPISERGYPRYEGSEIERLLKEDVKELRSQAVKPETLWMSRPEYIEMPLAIFRSHKNREERALTEKVYWQQKRNDKGRKKHEKLKAKQEEETGTVEVSEV